MAGGFRNWTSPSRSTPNINEASSKDVAAPLHRNVLSWGVWRGLVQKESTSPRAMTHSRTAVKGPYSSASNLLRSASVPDVMGRNPKKAAFSSITIATRKVLPSPSTSRETVFPSSLRQPLRVFSAPKETSVPGVLPLPSGGMRVSESQPDLCRQNQTIVPSNDFRQALSPADGLSVRDRGKGKAQRVCHVDGGRKQDVRGSSLMDLSSQPSFRSCVHLEMPLRSASSVLFLDKSLCISLQGLKERRASQPTLFRSTFSIRLRGSSCCKSSTNKKAAKTTLVYGRPRSAKSDGYKCNNQESDVDHYRVHLRRDQGNKVKTKAPACDANSLDKQLYGSTSGSFSFRKPSHSNTKAETLKGNADEADLTVQSKFRRKEYTFKTLPGDSRSCKNQRSDLTVKRRQDTSTEPQRVFILENTLSVLKANSLKETPKTLSLKEALELFRPDFISRSQGRVRRLEHRAMRRRALQESNPDLVQDLGEDGGRQRRKCTTPDPLSDNLFKPRERSISGREMQLRSRRIYNKLPEVTKKKEEEKKRAVSQTNRLRAEVFKKRLLDQILQR